MTGQGAGPLSDRDERIIHAYVVRRRTQSEIAAEFGLSQPRISKIIADYQAALKPIDPEQVRRELMEIYVDTLRRTAEIEAMEGAPVTAGKDGDLVVDPETGQHVRDYSGRLAAHNVRMRATEHMRKMLGLDAAERVEVKQQVRYELIGVDPQDLT